LDPSENEAREAILAEALLTERAAILDYHVVVRTAAESMIELAQRNGISLASIDIDSIDVTSVRIVRPSLSEQQVREAILAKAHSILPRYEVVLLSAAKLVIETVKKSGIPLDSVDIDSIDSTLVQSVQNARPILTEREARKAILNRVRRKLRSTVLHQREQQQQQQQEEQQSEAGLVWLRWLRGSEKQYLVQEIKLLFHQMKESGELQNLSKEDLVMGSCLGSESLNFSDLWTMMKILTGDKDGWFAPQSDFFKKSTNIDFIRRRPGRSKK